MSRYAWKELNAFAGRLLEAAGLPRDRAEVFARALVGLSPYRRRVRTQTLGFLEIAYGLLVVILSAVGYAL